MKPQLLEELSQLGYNIGPYLNKPIIFDTGPLLFYLAGLFEPSRIGSNKFTKEYTPEEFALLYQIGSSFKSILISPHILTEVSNLINRDIEKNGFNHYMNSLKVHLNRLSEQYTDKKILLELPEFVRLGITDVSIMELSKSMNCYVLTKDLKLELACIEKKLHVIHFDKIRKLVWRVQ